MTRGSQEPSAASARSAFVSILKNVTPTNMGTDGTHTLSEASPALATAGCWLFPEHTKPFHTCRPLLKLFPHRERHPTWQLPTHPQGPAQFMPQILTEHLLSARHHSGHWGTPQRTKQRSLFHHGDSTLCPVPRLTFSYSLTIMN